MTLNTLIDSLNAFQAQYNTSPDPNVQKLCRYVNSTVLVLNQYVGRFPEDHEICNLLANDIARMYMPTKSYDVGDFCMYHYKLYICTSHIEENEDTKFNTQHWMCVNIADSLGSSVKEAKDAVETFDSRLSYLENTECIVNEDTTEGWNSNPQYVPKYGEICLYVDYYKIEDASGQIHTYPAVKIGDGNAYLIDTPFVDEGSSKQILEKLNSHESNLSIHVTPQEKSFWNNKLNCSIVNETLVLNRN